MDTNQVQGRDDTIIVDASPNDQVQSIPEQDTTKRVPFKMEVLKVPKDTLLFQAKVY